MHIHVHMYLWTCTLFAVSDNLATLDYIRNMAYETLIITGNREASFLGSTAEARNLEHDRPPPQIKEGTPAETILIPCSNFLESTVVVIRLEKRRKGRMEGSARPVANSLLQFAQRTSFQNPNSHRYL